MLLLGFLSESLSRVAWLGVWMELQTWMCPWTGHWGGLGHTRAGKETSTGGFAELKERLKVREQELGDIAVTTHSCWR